MNRFPLAPFAAIAAIAAGCLLGFSIVNLAQQDRQALARCENRGASIAECRLLVLGR